MKSGETAGHGNGRLDVQTARKRSAQARSWKPGRRRQPSGARERWKPVRGETCVARLDAKHESAARQCRETPIGLQFESEGYAVTYRGLQFGFVDNGVDLILERDGETIYVQCKYTLGKRISANEVRWILHKADAYLAKQYQGRRLHFHLVVPDSKRCFSSVKLRLNGVVKKHSTARYFEEHNNLQNRVRLKVVEVPMRGHSHETPLVSAG